MSNLANQRCIPCEEGALPLNDTDIDKLTSDLGNGWTVMQHHHLTKTFKFNQFLGAVDWVNRVARLSEEQSHHPDIHIHYNKVTLDIWTHKAGGLTSNDFILAAKVDQIPRS